MQGSAPGGGWEVHDDVGAPAAGHPALTGLIGHWRGTTLLAAGPWGPERSVDAEVSYSPLAGGFGVVQSYRHVEADGRHFEGHGIFSIDPVRKDVLWYYVDSTGASPAAAARCTWHGGVIRVERQSGAGWTRHAISVEGGVLQHVTELRSAGTSDADAGPRADADGKYPAYRPFMRSVFRRA